MLTDLASKVIHAGTYPNLLVVHAAHTIPTDTDGGCFCAETKRDGSKWKPMRAIEVHTQTTHEFLRYRLNGPKRGTIPPLGYRTYKVKSQIWCEGDRRLRHWRFFGVEVWPWNGGAEIRLFGPSYANEKGTARLFSVQWTRVTMPKLLSETSKKKVRQTIWDRLSSP